MSVASSVNKGTYKCHFKSSVTTLYRVKILVYLQVDFVQFLGLTGVCVGILHLIISY